MKSERSRLGLRKLLIANRGEVAVRIMATARRMGLSTVAVYSEADRDALHVRLADQAVLLGPASASESYLKVEAILEAAERTGVDAIHPGYGFLAENSDFARRVREAGLTFVGPTPEVIATMGSKVAARELCRRAGVPIVPGSGAGSDEELLEWAEQFGYPVMLKASAGGGGKGMRRLESRAALESALPSARREAEKAFGSGELYLERALVQARHLEVQVVGDHQGQILHLGVRECSLQRRHQKLIEESPPVNVSSTVLQGLTQSALRLAREVKYTSLGTVEYLVSGDEYYFLEMNTRLQVEHPVTEAVTGLDLVELQLGIAEGRSLPFRQEQVPCRGHAIEARVTCEDPYNGFLPATGPVLLWRPCSNARVDAGIETGGEVGPHYDSMVAKIISWAQDRPSALRRLAYSLQSTVLLGLPHNIDFLRVLLEHPEVVSGRQHTELVESLQFSRPEVSDYQRLAVVASQAESPSSPHPLPTLPVEYRFEDGRHVRVRDGRYQVDDRFYQVRVSRAGLEIDGLRQSCEVANHLARWWVHTSEGTGSLTLLPRHPLPQASNPQGSLKAPMPGSVVEVMVRVGQQVESGQPLLKLEAMKMEHLICAPAAGTVTALPFSVGDQVEVGCPLLEMS